MRSVMKNLWKTLTLPLALSIGVFADPQANAGLVVGGLWLTYHPLPEAFQCVGGQDPNCLGPAMFVIGAAVAIIGISDGNATAGFIGLPAPTSDIEAAISTELPFLNTSDVYALGAMVRQKLDQGQLTRVSDPRAGQGY